MFSEEYGHLRTLRAGVVREGSSRVSEEVVQSIWYDQLFTQDDLFVDDGRALKIVSPGWWNRSEGPDFKGAQLEFNGKLRSGDVEIHLRPEGWAGHGHHLDPRYDDVILHVVLEGGASAKAPRTSAGKPLPFLVLSDHLDEDVQSLAERIESNDYLHTSPGFSHCAALVEAYGTDHLTQLLMLSGQWRMLFKARSLRERMDRVGMDQAVYEAFLSGCGFSHFKHHFAAIARQLPYERAAQLAAKDPLLLEAALLQLGGLLPSSLPEGTSAVPHYARLRSLRRDRLSGLRSIPLAWNRAGVRPNNNPERRLAGAARFVARCAAKGFTETLHEIWLDEMSPLERRRKFENLFPSALGFWSTHCTWTGKKLAKATAPIGPSRVRSIIGNVFVPAGLARARADRNRLLEEEVLRFFTALPKEGDNHILKRMLPRLYGEKKVPKLTFCLQQGLLQMYHDWCEPNPSCRNCPVLASMDVEAQVGAGAGPT